MIFGFKEDELQNLKAVYTVTEINQQPNLWRNTYELIAEDRLIIKAFMDANVTPETRVVLTGAGTSDYVGDTLVYELTKMLKCRVESIATTDLVTNPDYFIENDTKTILVSYARSGNSPESVGAYELFNKKIKDIKQLVITCDEDGELAKRARKERNSLVVLMPKEANDKGFAMTSSFSCMMLATLLIFDINNLDNHKQYIDIIADQGKDILENKWKAINELAEYEIERLVYLGSGALKGICQEMALKVLELTAGRITAVHESILGFRHGPKSIINEKTLVIVMNSVNDYTNLYDLDLIREIYNDEGHHKIAVIDYKNRADINSISDSYITIAGKDVPEIYAVFNFMLFGQMFGVLKSIKIGNTPDNPNPKGVVNRVVKGVIIHEY